MTVTRTGLAIGAAGLLVLARGAAGQAWQVFVIHPDDGYFSSYVHATLGRGVQLGHAHTGLGGTTHAGLWTGTAVEDFIDLHPAGSHGTVIRGGDGSMVFAGYQYTKPNFEGTHAMVWQGLGFAPTDLHRPDLFTQTYCYGSDGVEQAGWGTKGIGAARALLWRGTPESMVMLHPDNAEASEARDVGSGRQAGHLRLKSDPARDRAGYWSGSAESFVDLTPSAVATSSTSAIGISTDGQWQAGWARLAGSSALHAALWNSTPGSFVDLSAGLVSNGAAAYDTDGGYQAGEFYPLSGSRRAAFWQGSAESFVSLHDLLPGGPTAWWYSSAESVYVDAEGVWVGGSAGSDEVKAVVWHLPAAGCVPDCDQSTGAGVLDFFDFVCFQDLFAAGDPYACDCDQSSGAGVCDFFDFVCFQDLFAAGC